jgi:hypothetical protein
MVYLNYYTRLSKINNFVRVFYPEIEDGMPDKKDIYTQNPDFLNNL